MDFWDANHGIVIGDAIGTQVAILTTADGGATWIRVPQTSLPAAQPGDGSFAASGTCLVTRPGGRAWIVASNPTRARVLHTADFGRTWTADSLPITTHSGSGPQSIAFRDNKNGIALGGGNGAKPGDLLAASTVDGGHTWIRGRARRSEPACGAACMSRRRVDRPSSRLDRAAQYSRPTTARAGLRLIRSSTGRSVSRPAAPGGRWDARTNHEAVWFLIRTCVAHHRLSPVILREPERSDRSSVSS